MGIYYWPVCVELGEMLDPPYAAKDGEWSSFRNPSGPLLAWTMVRRWCGHDVKMIHDAGGFDELESMRLQNVWDEVASDYLKRFGPILGAACVKYQPLKCLCVACNQLQRNDE